MSAKYLFDKAMMARRTSAIETANNICQKIMLEADDGKLETAIYVDHIQGQVIERIVHYFPGIKWESSRVKDQYKIKFSWNVEMYEEVSPISIRE